MSVQSHCSNGGRGDSCDGADMADGVPVVCVASFSRHAGRRVGLARSSRTASALVLGPNATMRVISMTSWAGWVVSTRWTRGRWPRSLRGEQMAKGKKNNKAEMYSSARFFTMTGGAL